MIRFFKNIIESALLILWPIYMKSGNEHSAKIVLKLSLIHI